jgi:transcription elongation factor GreA
MAIGTQRVWLSEETFDRARVELAMLRMEQATGSRRGGGDEEQRVRRMRRLQELISSAAIGQVPPDDGVAEPGMVLTVRYEADGLTDRFLMADREESPDDDLWICSPDSPLGAALLGARVGDRREFLLPGRGRTAVSLVKAVPYRRGDRPGTR